MGLKLLVDQDSPLKRLTLTGAIGGTINALGKIGLAASGIEAIGKSAALWVWAIAGQRRVGNDYHFSLKPSWAVPALPTT
jgi:hypothetical protein